MGVKFSQLPVASSVATDDYLAVLDSSEGILKRCEVDKVGGGREITQAQYEALTPEEQNSGLWYITDKSSTGITVDSALSTTSTNPVSNSVITTRTNQISDSVGTFEPSSVAAYAHAVGEYFMWIGQFVKVTAAIAVGDTIAIGTNVASTNVAAVLSELNSNFANHFVGSFRIVSYGTYNNANLVVTIHPTRSYMLFGRHNSDEVQCCIGTHTKYEILSARKFSYEITQESGYSTAKIGLNIYAVGLILTDDSDLTISYSS